MVQREPLKLKGPCVNNHWNLAEPRTPEGGVLAVGDTQGWGPGRVSWRRKWCPVEASEDEEGMKRSSQWAEWGGGDDALRGPVTMRRRG